MPLPAYVLDSCSLIHLERSSDLRRLPPAETRMFVPDRVVREVNKPKTRLATWLRVNRRVVTRLLPEEGRLYLRFVRDGLDDGESAALAMALHREATLVTDDRAARAMASGMQVRSIETRVYLVEVLPEQGKLI